MESPAYSWGSFWDRMSPWGGWGPAQGPAVLSPPARPLWTLAFLCPEVPVEMDGLCTVDTRLLSPSPPSPNPETPLQLSILSFLP